MGSPKYPLDPLARVRSREVDEAARELGDSVRAREVARGARVATEARRDAHARDAERTREDERAALERGELRAGDLMRQDAWEHRVAAERAEHERNVVAATARENDARSAENAAQGALAHRKADEGAVAKHRAKWDAAEAKKRDARDEEAAVEAWRPKGER